VDLGGIGEGMAVDAAIAELGALGVDAPAARASAAPRDGAAA
jgi:hypothetical protein